MMVVSMLVILLLLGHDISHWSVLASIQRSSYHLIRSVVLRMRSECLFILRSHLRRGGLLVLDMRTPLHMDVMSIVMLSDTHGGRRRDSHRRRIRTRRSGWR